MPESLVLRFDGSGAMAFYDEDALAAVGAVVTDVKRATDIEFDAESGAWQVRVRGVEGVQFSDIRRSACILWEHRNAVAIMAARAAAERGK